MLLQRLDSARQMDRAQAVVTGPVSEVYPVFTCLGESRVKEVGDGEANLSRAPRMLPCWGTVAATCTAQASTAVDSPTRRDGAHTTADALLLNADGD
ncbi:hypothetical protein CORC01_08502 [Colletotrichum orchidophilum]|uniref:Uncharacterized protein n=1 Tax=Colletotrichum orchidophilum TaxID=1209926 RepID=A0A1G4B483_9PEZI|nr:uncharacterized protein CORC01_08502 [Colletotrichum orchidophilum]OHE96125.1 hypothetical protein CORC01_08502 [Colletotrichum orchidophilum]